MEQQRIFQKYLYNQVSLAVAATGLIASIIFWVTSPVSELKLQIVKLESQVESNETIMNELEKIKNNDLHEVQLRMDRIEARQIEELQAIARIEALLGNRE